jgi:hypothetical protein
VEKKRLVLEHSTMMERWSSLQPKLCRNASGSQLWWELEINGEGGNRLPVRIEYPPCYPASPPNIVIRASLPAGTPHLLTGNRMCWHYPGENKRNRNVWCPNKDTAAMCVGVALRWFCAFLVYLSIGEWPVPDARNA